MGVDLARKTMHANQPAPHADRRQRDLHLPSAVPTPPKPNIAAASNLLWVAPVSALRYSGYMATAKKPPDKLAGSLRHRQTSIDEMRASARMRARLMKKTPKSMDFPHGLVEVTNPGPSQSSPLWAPPGARALTLAHWGAAP